MYYIKVAGEYMLKMDLEYVGSILFARLDGSLTRRTSYKINNYLLPLILKHKIKYVIYNLENLKSIDESGVDAILNTKVAIKKMKGKIYLCELNKEVFLRLKRAHIKTTTSELTAKKQIEV